MFPVAGRTTNDILWRFLADTKSLERGSRRAQGDFRDTERSSDKMQQGLGIATKAFAALGLAMGVNEVKDLVLESITLGRTAEATAASFNIVFGPAADDLRARLDEARKAMGLGVDEMEAMTLTTGTLATGMGLSEEAAAEMAGSLFILAGDLAAFNPKAGTTEEALNGLQAAIRGEFDPLERFGVKLSAAEINTRAMADSAADSVSDLSAQDKALATLALALEATTKQQGALERADASGGREIERLTAKTRDLRVEFGKKLVPIVDDLAGSLGNLTNSVGEADDRSFLLLDTIQVLTGAVRGFTTATEDSTTSGVDPFTDAVAGATDWLGKALGFIPPVSQGLHDQAEAWRDDARGINAATTASGRMTAAQDVLLTAAQNSRQGMLNARDAALRFGAGMNEAEDDAWDLAGALSALGDFGNRVFPSSSPTIAVPEPDVLPTPPSTGGTGRGSSGSGGVQLAEGGMVPGATGTPVAATVHGGEMVLNPDQQRALRRGSAGAGTVVNITVEAGIGDPMAIAEAVAEAVRLYEQTNGPIR